MWLLLLVLVALMFGFGVAIEGLKWLLIIAVILAIASGFGYMRR